MKHANSNHSWCWLSSSKAQEKLGGWRNSCKSLQVQTHPSFQAQATRRRSPGLVAVFHWHVLSTHKGFSSPPPECGVGSLRPPALILGTGDWPGPPQGLARVQRTAAPALPCVSAVRRLHIDVDTPDQATSLGNGRTGEGRNFLNVLSGNGLTRKRLPPVSHTFSASVRAPPW